MTRAISQLAVMVLATKDGMTRMDQGRLDLVKRVEYMEKSLCSLEEERDSLLVEKGALIKARDEALGALKTSEVKVTSTTDQIAKLGGELSRVTKELTNGYLDGFEVTVKKFGELCPSLDVSQVEPI